MSTATLAQPTPPPTRPLTPLERDILVATWQAPNCTLRRIGSGFVAAPSFRTSGATHTQGFTKRLANRLRDEGLIAYDDDDCPGALHLTDAGADLVQQLLHAANEAHA